MLKDNQGCHTLMAERLEPQVGVKEIMLLWNRSNDVNCHKYQPSAPFFSFSIQPSCHPWEQIKQRFQIS